MKSRDKNMISGYIGRLHTWIIASFVLAVTISALITMGGITPRATITICFVESDAAPIPAHAAALERLLSESTQQPVRISPAPHAGGCDLVIMPTIDWLSGAHDFEGTPIYSLAASADRNDESVIVTLRDDADGERGSVTAATVTFTNSRSINGFWNQLEFLRENDIHLPADLDSFRFAGNDDRAGERAIVAVLSGGARFGACRANILRNLEDAGTLPPDRLAIVAGRPALPDVLIISSRDGATHYRAILDRARSICSSGGAIGSEETPDIIIEALSPAVLEYLRSIERLMGNYRGQF